jgi:hypothetical protein
MIYKRKPPPGNARRVRHINKNIAGITTNKCGRLVQFESEQERKLILLLERDATVTDFISQPETLRYVDENGRSRQYTPDFQIWRDNGQIELHEVVITQRRQTKETIRQRENAARQICQQRHWTYHIHTEETLPVGYEYANLDVLATFRANTYANEEIATWWLNQLQSRGPVHPQLILTEAPPIHTHGLLLNTLYHLLWHSRVQMVWDAPFIWRGSFHPDARIWLATKKTQASHSPSCLGQEVQR